MDVTLTVPAECLAALGEEPEQAAGELRLLAAVKLYELGRMSSGAAAGFAGIPRTVFLARLVDYGVEAIACPPEDLDPELANAPDVRGDQDSLDEDPAWRRILSLAGSIDSGEPTGADNEAIDRDLAEEYAAPHPEPGWRGTMAQTVQLDLPDEVYGALQRLANERGEEPERLALEWIQSGLQAALPVKAAEAGGDGLRRLMSYAGFASLDPSVGSDNESIDRDLTDEYAGETTD